MNYESGATRGTLLSAVANVEAMVRKQLRAPVVALEYTAEQLYSLATAKPDSLERQEQP